MSLIGNHLSQTQQVIWYLDSPVSNSGRLKKRIEQTAETNSWNWQVELVHDPDAVLKRAKSPVVTADSVILDHCQSWINLAREIIETHIAVACIIDMRSL